MSQWKKVCRHARLGFVVLVLFAAGGQNGCPVNNDNDPNNNLRKCSGDRTANAGERITLDASGSFDPDNDLLTFLWEQTSGTPVTLTNANTAVASFTVPNVDGALRFRVTVTDGRGGIDQCTVTITVNANAPPIANAGLDINQCGGFTVTLDGSASSDPDGDAITFSWIQTAGTPVTINGATTAKPTVLLPNIAGTLTFQLTVSDGQASSAVDGTTDSVNVIVRASRPPVANAGFDQSQVHGGKPVTLNGSASTDPDGDALAFSWQQTGGPAVVLTGANTAQPTFTAPNSDTTLTFQLTVTGSCDQTSTDSVSIFILANRPPVANAGPDQQVDFGAPVTLNGLGSFDPDGDPLTFSWVQTAGTPVTLTGANTATPSFTSPVDSIDLTLTFELTVSDGFGGSDTDSVNVLVTSEPTTPPTPTPPSVTINQAATQSDPTSSLPINFTVVFSENVTGFDPSDVTIGGDAPGTKDVSVTGGPAVYNVAVSGFTNKGTVTATIGANVAFDNEGTGNTNSTSTDNQVSFAPIILLFHP